MKIYNYLLKVYCVLGVSCVFLYGCGGTPGTENSQESFDQSESNLEVSAEPESNDDAPGSTTTFRLKVLTEAVGGGNPDFPDTSVSMDQIASGNMTVQGDEIQIHEKLFIRDSLSPNPKKHKNLFFVWSEELEESVVTSATFSNRVLNSQNKWVGNLKPKQAWHDTTHHRWFIPLSELYKDFADYPDLNVDLADTQVIDLDLILKNGKIITKEIKFQVSGPFPQIAISTVPPAPVGTPAQFVKASSNKGWPILKEQLTNPTSRSFYLWLKAVSKTLNLATYFRHGSYQLFPNDPPMGIVRNLNSMGRLEVSHLRAIHQDGTRDQVDIKSGQWFKLTLKPSETLTLEWVAQPGPKTKNCPMPRPSNINANWTTYTQEVLDVQITNPQWYIPTYTVTKRIADLPSDLAARMKVSAPPNFKFGPPQSHHTTVRTSIVVEAGVLTGAWSREIRMVHPFTSSTQVPVGSSQKPPVVPLEHVVVAQGALQGNIIFGQPPANPIRWHCQGVFP